MKIQPKKPLSLLWPNLNGVTQVHRLVIDDVAKQGWITVITKMLFYSKDGLYHMFCPKRHDSQGAHDSFSFLLKIWAKPKRGGEAVHLESHNKSMVVSILLIRYVT